MKNKLTIETETEEDFKFLKSKLNYYLIKFKEHLKLKEFTWEK